MAGPPEPPQQRGSAFVEGESVCANGVRVRCGRSLPDFRRGWAERGRGQRGRAEAVLEKKMATMRWEEGDGWDKMACRWPESA